MGRIARRLGCRRRWPATGQLYFAAIREEDAAMSASNLQKIHLIATRSRPPTGQTLTLQSLRLLKLRDVANVLSISTVTVRRRVRDGSLPAVRIKGRLYFHPHEVKAFLAKHATPLWEPPEA
jgi:excisionase family DNA binding protein